MASGFGASPFNNDLASSQTEHSQMRTNNNANNGGGGLDMLDIDGLLGTPVSQPTTTQPAKGTQTAAEELLADLNPSESAATATITVPEVDLARHPSGIVPTLQYEFVDFLFCLSCPSV
jgi:hypothetical protein